MEQVLQRQDVDVDEGLRQKGQNIVQHFASWLNANVAPAQIMAVVDFYPGFDPRGAFSWLEDPARRYGFFLLAVPVVKEVKSQSNGGSTLQPFYCVLLSAKEVLSAEDMAATFAKSDLRPLDDRASRGDGVGPKTSDSSSEQSRQYASDEELQVLTATFTEMASSAGRVAESLSRINSLAEEIHAELRATHEALAVPTRSPAEEGILR